MKTQAVEETRDDGFGRRQWLSLEQALPADLLEVEGLLTALASVFFPTEAATGHPSCNVTAPEESRLSMHAEWPDVAARYRILVEQIPAVVFMAFIDKGIGEAYISPQIEAMLGFTQEEWLDDPVRWYQQIHPNDKARWSVEAAQMLLTGEPLRSAYRLIARDGRVVWLHCEARMVRHADGRPWFMHGVGFDITELKQADAALREYAERMQILSRRLIEVQEAERRRVALELHDEIGQLLTGLKLTLEMGARLPAEEARDSIAQAQIVVNELMARTRQLSLDLRPATLDHLGLLSALFRHIKHYTSQTQVQVTFKHSGLEGWRFAPEVETAAFRIVQEALTNVARHAGVNEVTLRVWADEHNLTVQIEDYGRGFDPEEVLATSNTSGLAGMRERALLLGGQLTIESRRGTSTRLTAEWCLSSHPDLRSHTTR